MAQLATVASIAATAANTAQGLMQMQASRKTGNAATAAAAASIQAARDAREAEAASARARQRRSILEKTIASTRARLAASGASSDSGSGEALIEGLKQDTAEEQAADDRQRALRRAEADAGDSLEEATNGLNARYSAGRRSLIDASGALTGFTRAVRSSSSLSSGLRSLLDVF